MSTERFTVWVFPRAALRGLYRIGKLSAREGSTPLLGWILFRHYRSLEETSGVVGCGMRRFGWLCRILPAMERLGVDVNCTVS